MTAEKTDNEIRILKKATCLSLSSHSTLGYHIGCNDQSEILFRIDSNSNKGYFGKQWVSLNAILLLINDAEEPFTWRVLQPLFKGQSLNTAGFLMAVIKSEGLVQSEKRKYIKKDSKPFLAEINKLIKPTNTSTKKSQKK